VKIMQDGVCENFTASMLAPYLDAHGHETPGAGASYFDPQELKAAVTAIDARGFQVHFHAIGDRAVREDARRGGGRPRRERARPRAAPYLPPAGGPPR
jgi:predicted amidohydrolase YtcJ